MGSFGVWHWLVILLVVALILLMPRRRDRTGKPLDAGQQPVFSSVVTDGSEAEHVDERLPRDKRRYAAVLVTAAAVVSLLWWFFRA